MILTENCFFFILMLVHAENKVRVIQSVYIQSVQFCSGLY